MIYAVVSLPTIYNYSLNKHLFKLLLVSSSVSVSQHAYCWCNTHEEETIIAGYYPKLTLQFFLFKIQTRQTSSKVNTRNILVYFSSRIMYPPRFGGGVDSITWTGVSNQQIDRRTRPTSTTSRRPTDFRSASMIERHACA